MDINLYATLRPIVGQKTIEVDLQPDANAQDLLDALVAKYPSMQEELLDEQMRLLPHMQMRINDREIIYLEENSITFLNQQTNSKSALQVDQKLHKAIPPSPLTLDPESVIKRFLIKLFQRNAHEIFFLIYISFTFIFNCFFRMSKVSEVSNISKNSCILFRSAR